MFKTINISNITKRIIKNTSFLIAPQFVNFGLKIVFTIIIARYLGSSNFGMFFFSLAFVQLFYAFSELGIWIIVIKDISRYREKELSKYINNAFTIRMCIIILISALIFLTISLLDYSQEVKLTIYILAIGTGLSNLVKIYLAAFRAFEDMKYEGISTILLNTVFTIVGVIFVLNGFSIVGLAFANLLGNICNALYIPFIYKKVFKKEIFKIEINLSFWKYLIKEGFPLGVSNIFVFTESKLDILLLGFFRSPVEVGWYSAARRICDMLRVFPTNFYSALFPVFSRFHKHDVKILEDISIKTCKFMMFIAFPIAVIVTMLSDHFILLLLGSEYLPAQNTLSVLVWLIVISYIGTAFGSLLISSDNSKVFSVIVGIQLGVTLLLSLILIPLFGVIGMAVAVVFSHGFNTLLAYMAVSKRIFSINIFNNLIVTVFSSVVMVLVMLLLKDSNFFLLLLSGTVSYLLSFYLIKDIYRIDIGLVKNI